MRTLLTPRAMRLLKILTPEPIALTAAQYDHPAVQELCRLGLAVTSWPASVRLTKEGVRAAEMRLN